MNHQLLISQLAEHLNTFTSLFTHCEEEQVHWKPLPEKWSLLEVVNHLYDEEREDFRYRLKATNRDDECRNVARKLGSP